MCLQALARMHSFGSANALVTAFARNTGLPGNIGLTGRANERSSSLAYEIPLVRTLD